eukprot:GAHX01002102.1.p1 GENE.GAHX01002102.1~~GAHX01002102.1.p1  ORF type:complete len:183 (-),score=42.64 GAHX01002102.1:214-762(-)
MEVYQRNKIHLHQYNEDELVKQLENLKNVKQETLNDTNTLKTKLKRLTDPENNKSMVNQLHPEYKITSLKKKKFIGLLNIIKCKCKTKNKLITNETNITLEGVIWKLQKVCELVEKYGELKIRTHNIIDFIRIYKKNLKKTDMLSNIFNNNTVKHITERFKELNETYEPYNKILYILKSLLK